MKTKIEEHELKAKSADKTDGGETFPTVHSQSVKLKVLIISNAFWSVGFFKTQQYIYIYIKCEFHVYISIKCDHNISL